MVKGSGTVCLRKLVKYSGHQWLQAVKQCISFKMAKDGQSNIVNDHTVAEEREVAQ